MAGNKAETKWLRWAQDFMPRGWRGFTAEAQRGLKTPGEPLPEEAREKMESRLGHELGSVRIHKGGQAADSAGELNARAFTVGKDIIFGTGEYKPNTASGERLLAHELAHVIQRSRGGACKGDPAQRNSLECAANQAANALLSPESGSVDVAGASGPMVALTPRSLETTPDPGSMSDIELELQIGEIETWLQSNPDDPRRYHLLLTQEFLRDIANERQAQRMFMAVPVPERAPEQESPSILESVKEQYGKKARALPVPGRKTPTETVGGREKRFQEQFARQTPKILELDPEVLEQSRRELHVRQSQIKQPEPTHTLKTEKSPRLKSTGPVRGYPLVMGSSTPVSVPRAGRRAGRRAVQRWGSVYSARCIAFGLVAV